MTWSLLTIKHPSLLQCQTYRGPPVWCLMMVDHGQFWVYIPLGLVRLKFNDSPMYDASKNKDITSEDMRHNLTSLQRTIKRHMGWITKWMSSKKIVQKEDVSPLPMLGRIGYRLWTMLTEPTWAIPQVIMSPPMYALPPGNHKISLIIQKSSVVHALIPSMVNDLP